MKANKKNIGVRLQKLLADRGYGSRRQMETWISKGRIKVDGQVAIIGQCVTRKNTVTVDNKALRERLQENLSKILMYHKPEGEICTLRDPLGRPTVFDNLPPIKGSRWVSIGRLDINTSGLLLFTTNGNLANKMMHPSSKIEREYRCRIFGEFDKEKTRQLLKGIEVDGDTMHFKKIKLMDDQDKKNRWVNVVLEEGKNREVRRLWEAVDCQVSRLFRIRYGDLQLPRDLRAGRYRLLSEREAGMLTRQIKALNSPEEPEDTDD